MVRERSKRIFMGRNFFTWIRQKAIAERVALCLALVIGIILAVAAWGKFFYPAELIKILDRWVSAFEVLFLLVIIYFRKRWQLWIASAVVFAGWFGYALCWRCLKLPCACMGAKLAIPTAFSMSIDLFFFVLSLISAYLLGARSRWIYLAVLSGMMAALIGYAFAEKIYIQTTSTVILSSTRP